MMTKEANPSSSSSSSSSFLVQKEGLMGETNINISDEEGEAKVVADVVASSIQKKLRHKSPIPSTCCIFKFPKHCDDQQSAYGYVEPSTVSIGPFHHGKEKLQSMEEVKLWYLDALISRAPTPQTNLEEFIQVIMRSKDLALECYEEHADHQLISGDKFIETMIIDGCFIIEFLRKTNEVVLEQDIDDPIFRTAWMYSRISEDLFLLENQLPWFVLEDLFNLTTSPNDRPLSLIQLAQVFSCSMMTAALGSVDNPVHLLDLLRQSISPIPLMNSADVKYDEPIRCIKDLQLCGVKFKGAGNANGILNVNFSNGVLTIPCLIIEDDTECLFKNLIAFEQCYTYGCNGEITSYTFLLDELIDSADDVHILRDEGVIRNALGSDVEVCNIINNLGKGVTEINSHYGELRQQINEYCQRRQNKWRATLMRDYFNSPWAAISVIAGFVILLLTVLQTAFSINNP